MTPDLINAVFELSGAVLMWLSVARLYRDKKVRGVYWPAMALFATWGGWNLIYYPVLGQWASLASACLLCGELLLGLARPTLPEALTSPGCMSYMPERNRSMA